MKLLVWAHLSLERWSNQDRSELRGQGPALPLSRARRGATCGQFCYIDGEVRKPSGSDTYLLRCRDLFARLDSFRVVYVAADQSMFAMAGSIFCPGARGRAEDRTACPSIRKSGDYWIMFYDRDLLEGRQTASFGKRQPDQLSDELRGSGGRSTRFCSAIGSNRARGCSQRKGPRRTTVWRVHNLTADFRDSGE